MGFRIYLTIQWKLVSLFLLIMAFQKCIAKDDCIVFIAYYTMHHCCFLIWNLPKKMVKQLFEIFNCYTHVVLSHIFAKHVAILDCTGIQCTPKESWQNYVKISYDGKVWFCYYKMSKSNSKIISMLKYHFMVT